MPKTKNTYTLPEVMALYNFKSRTTFWRARNKGAIPAPDITAGHPLWFHATLAQHIPNLTTNPLA